MQLPLLMSAFALLASQVAMRPTRTSVADNLDRIIDLLGRVNQTFAWHQYEEDVKGLFDAGCKDEFFCKVHHNLIKHTGFRFVHEIGINLEAFINGTNVNCLVEASSGPSAPLNNTLEFLKGCIQRWNFRATPSPEIRR